MENRIEEIRQKLEIFQGLLSKEHSELDTLYRRYCREHAREISASEYKPNAVAWELEKAIEGVEESSSCLNDALNNLYQAVAIEKGNHKP